MGLVDLHTHGLCGRDSDLEDPAEYLRLAESYKAHGTAAFLPTLSPAPIEKMRARLRAIRAAVEAQGARRLDDWVNHRDQEAPDAIIIGAHLEGPFLNPRMAGALDRDGFIEPTPDNLARLTDGFEEVVKVVTVAPELPGALKVIDRLAAMGVRVNMGHSAATFEQARAGKSAGATGVTHIFNAMPPFHHREPGLAGFALLNDKLYVEVIADMAHLHPAVLKLVFRLKPPSRILLVSDSLGAAKSPGVPSRGPLYLPDGRTLAGSGITLADAVENAVSLGVPEDFAASFAGKNPRRYLEGPPF